MSDLHVKTYRPSPSEFAWTFGGVKSIRSVRPGMVMELWTEDAFGGKVRGPDDLVSKVIEFPFVNRAGIGCQPVGMSVGGTSGQVRLLDGVGCMDALKHARSAGR